MNPPIARTFLLSAIVASAFTGSWIAFTYPEWGSADLTQQRDRPVPVAASPVPEVKLPRPVVSSQPTRSQELQQQFDRSGAGVALKQLKQAANDRVASSKAALEGLVKRTVEDQVKVQQENLKQILIGMVQSTVTGKTDGMAALAQEFEGIQLSPEQQAQVARSRQALQTAIVEQVKSNPALLQQVIADLEQGRVESALQPAMREYETAIAQVLTPEQQKQWQQNFDLRRILGAQ